MDGLVIDITHPQIGDDYYILNDKNLRLAIEGAKITHSDNCYVDFEVIAGYLQDGSPFILTKSTQSGGLHNLIRGNKP